MPPKKAQDVSKTYPETINRPARRVQIEVLIRPKPKKPLLTPPPKISLLPKHDGTSYIVRRVVVPIGAVLEKNDRRTMCYVVGWTDLPAAKVTIPAHKIYDYCSPRVVEDWEYQDYLRKEREEEAAQKAKEHARSPTRRAAAMKQGEKGRGRHPRARLVNQPPPEPKLGKEERELLAKKKASGPSLSTPQKRKLEDFLDVDAYPDDDTAISRQLFGDGTDFDSEGMAQMLSTETGGSEMDESSRASSTMPTGFRSHSARSSPTRQGLFVAGSSHSQAKVVPHASLAPSSHSQLTSISSTGGTPENTGNANLGLAHQTRVYPIDEASLPKSIGSGKSHSSWSKENTNVIHQDRPGSQSPKLISPPPWERKQGGASRSYHPTAYTSRGLKFSPERYTDAIHENRTMNKDLKGLRPSFSDERPQARTSSSAAPPSTFSGKKVTPIPVPTLPHMAESGRESSETAQHYRNSSQLQSGAKLVQNKDSVRNGKFFPTNKSATNGTKAPSNGVPSTSAFTPISKARNSFLKIRGEAPSTPPVKPQDAANGLSASKDKSSNKSSNKKKRQKAESIEDDSAEEAEQQWEVKRLEGDKIFDIDGKPVRHFKVRWEGDWPPDQNPTWEPEENIAPALVKKYLKKKGIRGSHVSVPKQRTLSPWTKKYASVQEAFEAGGAEIIPDDIEDDEDVVEQLVVTEDVSPASRPSIPARDSFDLTLARQYTTFSQG